ncbi:MAG: rRNA maturation RNase YbeY [Azoarcus sp.]|jgi:probable rRNA maturation factor|nr:rRNA maturation RNase YbeY [Azoarcus sp.]
MATDKKKSARRPMLTLTVQRALAGADRGGAPLRAQLLRWARAVLLRDVTLTVRLVGEHEGRALNHSFRGKDAATNVLTFVYGEDASFSAAPLAGDIVLCAPVVAREAAEQGKALEAHYAHLLIHGMLHLQGFDHETQAEAENMEAHERGILRTLGFDDPYQDGDGQ